MDRADASIIGFVETAYDLDIDDESWLPTLLEKGRHAMDRGLGVAGVLYGRPLHGGPVELLQIHTLGCPEDFAERHLRAIQAIPHEVLREQLRPGQAGTMSENSRQPETDLARYRTHVPYCRDVLGITAVDPNGSGAAIVVPLQEKTTLSGRARARWQMMGAHVCAAHRLRQSLSRERDETDALTSRSEAIVDPAGFRIVDASGDARTATSRKRLRNAAMKIDRARGFLGEQDAEAALELWKALVDGRWTLVDWFDSDERRFILALPNPPELRDPRGLKDREAQVVAYVVAGLTNKMIAYHLGVSTSRVSALLRSAMRKLNVRTRASLIRMFREMPSIDLND